MVGELYRRERLERYLVSREEGAAGVVDLLDEEAAPYHDSARHATHAHEGIGGGAARKEVVDDEDAISRVEVLGRDVNVLRVGLGLRLEGGLVPGLGLGLGLGLG